MPIEPTAAAAGIYDAATALLAPRLSDRDRADPEDLAARVNEAVSATGSFADRWATVRTAPATTRALADDLLTLHLLFPRDVSISRKVSLLGTSPGPELRAALAAGVAPGGTAFQLRRLSQLGYLARAVAAARAGSATAVLSDPIRCRAWLHAVAPHGGHSQREALAHLLHPAAFEPIAVPAVKQRLREALVPDAPTDTDDDAALTVARDRTGHPAERSLLELAPRALTPPRATIGDDDTGGASPGARTSG
ncbi:hypothetical protein ER308_06585 [Egibacter rhizosphaerae]|uniref:Uncharacterized protein n=1 Tax=Egibacter rhizosphaerae TaxID=1670831 RepID=A0A411YDG5_9ACTN|nr:hypothetical protein [Egibacter rhizosphaerae]QBI19240.1 hypothetical protein ER308_06585 [Egibacter rhizosphaerae]